MLRSIKSEQRAVRELLVRIEGSTGAVSLDEGGLSSCTVVDGGVGIYTLTFATAFDRIPIISGCVVDAAAHMMTPSAVSTTACTINVYDDAGVAADADVHVRICGFDSTDET